MTAGRLKHRLDASGLRLFYIPCGYLAVRDVENVLVDVVDIHAVEDWLDNFEWLSSYFMTKHAKNFKEV